MPPKPPKKAEPSKKTEQKKKDKIVEDKTFGLKNKKGAKQQKFIQTVQVQVNQQGKTAKQLEKEKLEKLAKKDEKKKLVDELNVLFKPVEQKLSKGADPKSVLCAFFKSGQCTKGDKCKFSHDLNIGRKAEKRSMYDDQRDDADTMENWDEAKLQDVVTQKHGESDKSKPKTDIICKYFLEALETSKYGWFWTCPNGESCIYRHALPPGFVLKKDQKKDEKEEEITLEDLIERERAALSSKDLTKVTLESFLKWKERKRKEKVDRALEDSEKKKSNYAAGKMFGISGREMFEFNPELIAGDDEEADDAMVYEREDDEENYEAVREIDGDMFAEETQVYVELPSGATAACQRLKTCNGNLGQDEDNDDDKLSEAAALPESDAEADNSHSDAAADENFIDENLFDGEDLDFVEEELENLEVVD